MENKRFVSKNLLCGCCGLGFKTWEGYVDQDQDAGYGICLDCQEDARGRNDEEMDKAIKLVSDSFKKPENKKKFDEHERWKQEAIVFALIEDGTLSFHIGK